MGIAERKQREKEQRRQHILQVAETIFLEKGINSSTMDEIAAVCELSKGTLYLYFKSKEELFLDICPKQKFLLHKIQASKILLSQSLSIARFKCTVRYYRIMVL